ncbi:MAG: tetratricopeptide repeat protein [Bacteroidetes bacterium]|nr:tetratricopeptide repeat protein [Bacteroidota bacterium]
MISQNDTAKINDMNARSESIRRANPDSAITLCNEALALSEKLNYTSGKINSYNNIGMALNYQHKKNDALLNLKKALELAKIFGNPTLIAFSYRNLSLIYESNANYGAAITNSYESLRIFESIKDSTGIMTCYNNIANVYNDQQNFTKALEFFLKAIPLIEKNDNINRSKVYGNLGLVYNELKNYDKALYYFFEALKIQQAAGNQLKIADIYTNLGVCFSSQGHFQKSLDYLFRAAPIYEATNNEFYSEIAYTNIGDNYIRLKKYKEAAEYLNKGLLIAQKIDDKEGVKVSCLALSELYAQTGDFKNAFLYNRRYMMAKDSLQSLQNQNQIGEIQTKYETDKRDREIELLNKDKQLQESIIEKQNIQKIAFITGIIVLLGFSVFIFNSFKRKQKDNKIIISQKEEVEKQKQLVDDKQKEIIDSIRYAQRIQKALLPNEKYFAKNIDRLKNSEK